MPEPEVQLRPLPYPYRAMLAICSDLDETPDRHIYRQIMEFLNTTRGTAMGEGLGLESGNTIYFDMPPDQFAYWNTDDAGRAMVRTLIGSGHIDCLHSYGDLAGTRKHAAAALDELCRHNCRLAVWIDHATAPTNFGADIMQGHGDEPGHAAYHADLTIDYGIRYVWRGRVTSVIGQNGPARPAGILTAAHPIASSRTLVKEAAKQVLARLGHERYAMHAPNRVLRPTTLRDGQPVLEFLRCNPHWGGVSSCDTGRGIGQVLTDRMLERLTSRGGVCVLYTHLGKIHRHDRPFDADAVAGLRLLAEAYRTGQILVTTTRRLLDYCRMVEGIRFQAKREGDVIEIIAESPGAGAAADLATSGGLRDGHGLAGLTFSVPRGQAVRLFVDGREAVEARLNPPDQAGRASISLPWRRLEWPAL